MFGYYKTGDLYLAKIGIASNMGGILLDDISESNMYSAFIKTNDGSYRLVYGAQNCPITKLVKKGAVISDISKIGTRSVFVTDIKPMATENCEKFTMRSDISGYLNVANAPKLVKMKRLKPLI